MQIFQNGQFVQMSMEELLELLKLDRKEVVKEIMDELENSKQYYTVKEVSVKLRMSGDRVRNIFINQYSEHVKRHGRIIHISKPFVDSLIQKDIVNAKSQHNIEPPLAIGKLKTRKAYRTQQTDTNS